MQSPHFTPKHVKFHHPFAKRLYKAAAILCLAACQTTQVRSTDKQANLTATPSLFANQANRQVVVVTTADWNATAGVLRRFAFTKGDWQQAGNDVPIVVGKNGLAWGLGLRDFPKQSSDPQKQEGDAKAPAGLFRLTQAMGYAEQEETQLPYTQATIHHECVDDNKSSEYNHVVDTRQIQKTWSSWEEMKRNDELYRYVVVVDHNATQPTAQPVAGKGSCIFMHVWRSQQNGVRGTAGCTAMAAQDAAALLRWLKPGAVVAQFPRSVYARHYAKLGLPQLPATHR